MAAAGELKVRNGDLPPMNERNTMRQAKVFTLYRNGDNFFPGKKFTWNQHQIRTFDTLLEHLSSTLKLRGGAVRRLYTPEHGHRVKNLEILEEGKAYVAAPQEAFRKLDYASIEQIRKRRNKKSQITYDVQPVVHTRHQVSGRIKRVNTMGKVIKCWPNGEDVSEPRTIHIPPSLVNEETWDRIHDLMVFSIRDLTGPVSRVYTRDGKEVKNPLELSHMGYYVIAPKFNAIFKDVDYKDVRRPNFHTSPVPERRVLPPVRSKNNSKSNSLQSSPDHSWASHPGSENGYSQKHRRNLARQRQEEAQSQGFYAKPTAHKRSGEAKAKVVNYDQDAGGVFRAKQGNKSTRGAQEVKESRNTRTEVPVDQRRAEVVEDEDTDVETKESARSNGPQEDIKKNKKAKEEAPKPAAVNGNRNGRQNDVRGKAPNEPAPAKAKTNSYRGPPPSNTNTNTAPASNGSKQSTPPATSTPKNDPKVKEVKKSKSPSPPPPAKKDISEEEHGPPSKLRYIHKRISLAAKPKAATKIQAQFRGHKTRKELEQQPAQNQAQTQKRGNTPKKNTPPPSNEMSEEEAATKIQARIRGHQTRKELEEKKAAPSPRRASPSPLAGPGTDQKSEAEKEAEAATKIQATYRGHKTRQELAQQQQPMPEGPVSSPAPAKNEAGSPRNDHLDERAKEEAAAVKIQATYRGHATRRELDKSKEQGP